MSALYAKSFTREVTVSLPPDHLSPLRLHFPSALHLGLFLGVLAVRTPDAGWTEDGRSSDVHEREGLRRTPPCSPPGRCPPAAVDGGGAMKPRAAFFFTTGSLTLVERVQRRFRSD